MNSTAIVVGGNSGIGRELQNRLRARHENVMAFSRNTNPSVDVTEEAPQFPNVDGPVHALAYCPGSINLKPFGSLAIKDFRADFEVNLLGAVRTIQHYLPNLKKSEHASIVLFSTVAAQTGMGFHASIAAAKGAVEGFGRSLAAELAPKIRVNVVAPSLTDTPLAQRLLRTDKQREAAADRHPLHRIGAVADVAAAADFLLSSESAWVTGQVVSVDGGLSSLRMM